MLTRSSGSSRTGLLAAILTLTAIAAGMTRGQEAPATSHGTDPDEVVIDALRAEPPLPSSRGSVIGRQDLLEIRVFQLDEMNQTTRVADDGSITLPLLGKIMIAGLTREEAEQRIASLLEERYVNNPQVTIFVREYVSRQVVVTGGVQRPGSYEMLGDRTVLEMIAVAGGTVKDVSDKVIVLRRNRRDELERIEVSLRDLVYGESGSSDLTLQPGDIVFVPVEEIVKVYVTGAVGKPGAIEVKRSEPISVLQAVTAAGGTTQRAAEKRAQVIRRLEDGTKEVIDVDLRRIKQGRAEDLLLEKDDVVFVPEAYF